MKILVTSRESLFPNIGGHREYLLETIKGLTEKGNSIDVLSWGIENNYTYNNTNMNEYHFNSDSDNLKINNKLKFLTKFASSAGIGQIHTIRHKGLEIKHAMNFLKTEYDIVIKNGPDSNGIAGYISNRLQIPMIERLDWVGLPYRSKFYRQWLNYIDQSYMPYNYLYRVFDKYITKIEAKSSMDADFVYTPTKNDMQKIGRYIDRRKLDYIIPFLNSANLNNVETKESKEEKKPLVEGKYILFYSTPSINAYEAIKYIYKISKLNEKINFVITGNFDNLQINFSRANLIFLGELPLETFYIILKKAYIVIFPLTLGHGIQMKLIRAFSFSKAVIANDGVLKPIEDLVYDNKNIIIGETPSKFYDKILYLYEDENIVKEIGSNSYKAYKEYFSPEVSIKKLNEYLQKCQNNYKNQL